MIVSLFLPDRIGSYYLLGKRVVGIEITDHAIYATIMHLTGNSRIIESIVQEKIPDDSEAFDEKVVHALRALKLKLGKYDEMYCSIPSSKVIFKELTLPFTGLKKIKMVVPFEVEAQLPFNLDEGIVDCIVTGVDTAEQTTDVLVGAMKRDARDRYVSYFKKAELPLDRVSVDIFELYSLYHSLQTNEPSVVALIELGRSDSTLGLIVDGRLKYVRSFTKGVLSKKEQELIQELMLDEATKEHLGALLDQLRMTLDGTLQKFPERSLTRVVITGAVTDIQDLPGVSKLVKLAMETDVDILDPKQLISKGVFESKVATIPGSFMSSIAIASSPVKTEDYTLLQEKAQQQTDQQIMYQLFTIAAITLTLFLSFSVYSFLRVRTLRKAHKIAEQEAIKELQKHFKLRGAQTRRLDIANKAAQKELKKQETAWRRISADNRYSYLKYLAGLTKCINMKESQLELDSITLKDYTIKLYGRVPGYQQLTKLQDQLECKLFKKVPKLQQFNFKSEPITLTVNPEAFNGTV